MLSRSIRIAIDYNRGLALPIRVGHGAWEFIAGVTAPIWAWSGRGDRSIWARPMLVALLIAAVLVPIDGVVSSGARAIPMGGDVRRVLNWLQEYGGLASLVVVAVVIWLLDPANRKRLADLAVAVPGVAVPGERKGQSPLPVGAVLKRPVATAPSLLDGHLVR